MREYSFVAWCDACPEGRRAKAAQTFTVGITEGEERPSLHVTDLCDEHAAMLNAVAKLLIDTPLFMPAPGRPRLNTELPRVAVTTVPTAVLAPIPAPAPWVETEVPEVWRNREPRPELESSRRSWSRTDSCPVCGDQMEHNSIVAHIWGVHRRDEVRPMSPTVCPECGYTALTSRMVGLHRHVEHGYDAIKEAARPLLAPTEPEPEPEPKVNHRSKPKKDYCPLCGKEMGRGGLIGHVWQVHRRNEHRPPGPTTCPTCGFRHPKREIVGMHRSTKHGYDPLAEALAGVKLPR